jgi:hypothetical protein
MSRSTSDATDESQRFDFESNEQTTRPFPKFNPFDLEAEARRLDSLACAHDDSDSTLMIGAEENQRLLASAFALGEAAVSRPAHDDEPTRALRAPQLFLVPAVEREVEPAPETMRMLIAVPLAAVLPPPSGERPRATSEFTRTARYMHAYEVPREAPRAASRAASTWLPRGAGQTWVVVAIWAMALSLLALLMLMVQSA